MTADRPVPVWLRPVQQAIGTVTAGELSRLRPPPDARPREGAVLMLFGDGPAGPDLLFIERAHHMRSHPGQVSFPGGALDPDDASPSAGALREAQEETGLDPSGVEVLGELPRLWLPPSNFAVIPVVGWWRVESPVSVVDRDEVHAVFRVPLDRLLDPAHRVTTVHPLGHRGPGFRLDGELVLWGFTAGIVSRLFDVVGWTRPWDSGAELQIEDWMIFGRSGHALPGEEEDTGDPPKPRDDIGRGRHP